MPGPQELIAERTKRVFDAIDLKKPDRVPMYFSFGVYAARYAGITVQEGFENPERWRLINEELWNKYQPDLCNGMQWFDIESNSILDTRTSKWPGHGLPPTSSHQFVEGEYMKADEYDSVLQNAGDFILRTYLPRTYSGLEGLKHIPPLIGLPGLGGAFHAIRDPAVIPALENLLKAAKVSSGNSANQITFRKNLTAQGFPFLVAPAAIPPFDVISDFLRGMRGAMMDMYRCPDKLLALQEKLLPVINTSVLSSAQLMGTKIGFWATHRGSDGFMSLKQFEKFYWPGLKAVLEFSINAGQIPCVFWEGNWDQRLKYLKELPRGKVLGWFDRTDLFKAKEIIGDTMCICGGMPISMLQTSTPEAIRTHTRKVINELGKGGGFIMGSSTVMDEAKPELVNAWVEATREFGNY